MTFRKIRLSAVAAIFSLLFIAGVVVEPADKSAASAHAASAEVTAAKASPAAPLQSNWVHWGCWSYFPAGGCRDIYRDPQGDYWICRACGTTTKPGSKTCSRISTQTLATGYWCS